MSTENLLALLLPYVRCASLVSVDEISKIIITNCFMCLSTFHLLNENRPY